MSIKLPHEVGIILNELRINGFEAFVVGGCVRDSLLHRKPKDWDITTNAIPEEIISIFENACFKTIPTGIKHGTITVLTGSVPYEITTYRVDGIYVDGRRPENVKFTTSISEDLSRRDFTINAMAFNEFDGLIDPFEGQNDLLNRVIACVGNPEIRFNEDALRMLRAVRFSAELDFNIHPDTFQAILENNILINKISKERIREEFNKILLSNPYKVILMNKTGLLFHILPEFISCIDVDQGNSYHVYNVGEHILRSVENIERNLKLRLTMLFHDIGKPQCKSIDESGKGHFYSHDRISSEIAAKWLKAMKYDSATVKRAKDLILYHDQTIGDSEKSVRKWLKKLGLDMLMELIKVKEADIKAQNPIYYDERYKKLQKIKIIIENVVRNNECFNDKNLAINGSDLIKAGFKEGREIGEILDKLLDKVIDDPQLNSKQKLMELAMKM